MNFKTRLSAFFAAAACLVVSPYAGADAPLTIDEAISTAQGKSPTLDLARAQGDAAKWRNTEAYSGFLPSVSVGAHYLATDRFFTFDVPFAALNGNPPSLTPSLDAEIGLKIPVFDGFRNFDRLHAAAKAGRAAELDADFESFRLRENVRLAYFAVIEAERLAIVANEDVRDLEDHLKLVQLQLRAGTTTQVELLRVETQLSSARSEKTNADDQIDINRQQLAQAMGEDEESRQVVGDLPVPDDAILSSIQAAPLQERYDLTALGLRAEAATDTHRGASKWWVPSISLLGEFVAFHAQATTISAYALGLSLSWSVFDGLTSYARSKEELAQERIALRTEDKAKLQARTDFQTYRRRYRYNLQKYRSRVDDVHRSEESVRLARQGFKAGTQTSTNVLDAEQDLFNARASLVEAQYGAFESLIRFELAVGRNVTQ